MTKKREWKNLTQKEKIILVCSFLFFVVMAYLFASSFRDDSSRYTVEKKECAEPLQCSLYVRISSKLSEAELSLIAKKLRETRPSARSVFIFYYLPCMELEDDPWAVVTVDPNLKTEIKESVLDKNPACLKSE